MKTINLNKFDNLPQRQKKYAKTKVALLNALLNALDKSSLGTVMIKELAKEAEVSEPTFFNYFTSKQDMLIYFIQIWSIEMQSVSQACIDKTSSNLEAIKQIFIQTANMVVDHPQIMLEIISFHTQNVMTQPHMITEAEKWLFFEDIEDVEKIEGMGLEGILPPLIDNAIKAKELEKDTDAQLLFLILSSLFFGTSLLVLKHDAKALPLLFEQELNILFERLS